MVRGGWDGHQPVEATELFIPFLEHSGYAVRVEESPAIYADAATMAGPTSIVQCVTMSRSTADELRACARRSRPAPAWPAGTAASPTRTATSSDYLQLIGGQFATPSGQGAGRAPRRAGRTTTCRTRWTSPTSAERTRSPRASRTSTWSPSSTGCCTTTTTTCWPRRPSRSGPGTRGTAPITSPAIWTRQWGDGRIFVVDPGAQPRRPRAPERPHHHREGDAVGEPHERRHRRSRRHLPPVPRHARRHSDASSIIAVADLDAARAAAVAADDPGVGR